MPEVQGIDGWAKQPNRMDWRAERRRIEERYDRMAKRAVAYLPELKAASTEDATLMLRRRWPQLSDVDVQQTIRRMQDWSIINREAAAREFIAELEGATGATIGGFAITVLSTSMTGIRKMGDLETKLGFGKTTIRRRLLEAGGSPLWHWVTMGRVLAALLYMRGGCRKWDTAAEKAGVERWTIYTVFREQMQTTPRKMVNACEESLRPLADGLSSYLGDTQP